MKQGKLQEQIQKYLLTSQTVMSYEQDKYSKYQNYLYKRALYGLNSFEKEEVLKMCSKKKRRINNVYIKAQNVINILKQKITIKYTNDLFTSLFPNSQLTKELVNNFDVDVNFKNSLTFKDLRLNKDHIITIFIAEGVLPKNFLSLKEEPISLKNASKT